MRHYKVATKKKTLLAVELNHVKDIRANLVEILQNYNCEVSVVEIDTNWSIFIDGVPFMGRKYDYFIIESKQPFFGYIVPLKCFNENFTIDETVIRRELDD